MAGNRSIQHDAPLTHIGLDTQAFQDLVRSHGVTMVHYRAMRCPIGVSERNDSRQPHHTHADCSNGAIYRVAGEATCLFQGNDASVRLADIGLIDSSTAMLTLPSFYDRKSEDEPEIKVLVAPFDRFYFKDTEAPVVNWHLVEAHATGIDRLQYPAVLVEHLVDSNGQEYRQDEDFRLVNGSIVWGSRRPPQDPETQRGCCYTVRYWYQPYWYVKQMVHEIRVSRKDDFQTGERKLVRMPVSVVLQRENVFENERRDDNAPADLRDMKSNPSGSFGAK